MLFYSTGGRAGPVTFRDAVLSGLAPDGGLWMPESFPQLPVSFFERLPGLSLQEIAFEVARLFIGDQIPRDRLLTIAENAIDFDAPMVLLTENMSVLELFHGPTLAFKDFGARFTAHLASDFLQHSNRSALVLVATSGDTGSAVAHAFFRMKGIRVVLLYPSGQVSHIQERQMTTLGENISSLEIAGTFDDCQNLVKQAFQDEDLKSKVHLMSANSINMARLIPQCFYYFYARGRLPLSTHVVFSVPSGNFGNLTAGLVAKFMGLPVHRFIAATNVNDTVPDYLDTAIFKERVSQRTLSNAMDVGNPSNFARMLALYDSNVSAMRRDISGYAFTDDQTRSAMAELYKTYGYVCDPHTAIAYLGWRRFPKSVGQHGVFLSTAHPAKFANIVKETIGNDVEIPERLMECLDKPKHSIPMENNFGLLKSFLLH